MVRTLWVAAVAVAVFGSGCANVKVMQREGCWVRQTESFPKVIREEVGFCARKPPTWSNDRVTRLVQECVAESDYRWQTEALNAWSRGAGLPAQSSEATVMKTCMDRANTVLLTENEELKRRVAVLTTEQQKLEQLAREDREHFRAAQEQMTQALGEAAKKPAPSAFATANSNGTATNESEQTADRALPNETNITLPRFAPTVVPTVVPIEQPKKGKAPEAMCTSLTKKKGGSVTCALPSPELVDAQKPAARLGEQQGK